MTEPIPPPNIIQTTLTTLRLLDLDDEMVSQINSTSFVNSNEKLLLAIIIELLSKINMNNFSKQILNKFPYYDTKEKNECKIIIMNNLQSLVEQNKLSSSIVKSSTLSLAKGHTTWRLLWKLSDLLLETNILSYAQFETPCTSSRVSNEEDSSQIEPIETIAMRRKEGVSMNMEEAQTLTQHHINKIRSHSKSILFKQKSLIKYSNELNVRLRQATQDIEATQNRLHDLQSRRGGVEGGIQMEKQVSELIDRIEYCLSFLEYISLSKRRYNDSSSSSSVASKDLEVLIEKCFERYGKNNNCASSRSGGEGDSDRSGRGRGSVRLEEVLADMNTCLMSDINTAWCNKNSAGGSISGRGEVLEELELQVPAHLVHALADAKKKTEYLCETLANLRQQCS